MYETIDINGTTYIKKTVGEMVTIIPADPANSDYQRYLNPETEQSTPNLAD
jgi:hypothetical protein